MDIPALDAAIAAKAAEIRELKAAKQDVKEHVAALLNLKGQFKALAGYDHGTTPGAPAAAPKPKQLTKKELRLLERQKQAEAEAAAKATSADPTKFGDAPLIQSREAPTKKFVDVGDIDKAKAGESFWVRGYLQNVRAKPKIAFLVLRQAAFTIQGVLSESKDVPKAMIKYADEIPRESVVDLFVTVKVAAVEIHSTTQKDVELEVTKVFTISKALTSLPMQIEDASRSDTLLNAEGSDYVEVGLDTRLDNRVLDLRTPANQAIMRIQSGVGQLFREFLYSKGFVEIHTPKLLGGASEGGANCFSFKYFDQHAVLAQSPQLHKQMACACAGLEKVFEIGPVFRAENSFTRRHLCEFTGLDLEMTIKEHYSECLDVFSELFIYVFDNLNSRFKRELAIINEQHPFEPLKYSNPTLILKFDEAVAMLNAAGIDQDPLEDLSTPNEKALGDLVKAKYDTDFYFLDKFPLAVRPFYTMPDPNDSRWSNSYDFMIRGQEILSGAQRVHDPTLLVERMNSLGVPEADLQTYVDAFKYGALPHAGGGVGLERVVMLFLGLENVRKASMFPRDPKRLRP
ncbi:aspartyl-tRNA synthetase [Saprolegnia diclina VS20]|uniref:aspartate--tRNA ligase n=1 Tax=Saprolegnia diclina (strain VS20) TaxID=1156394 RepID=T0S5Y6_SAPDV|nr:aspartyl-tRNA synthetase [Saprolegnia diclina VS20]EQC40488.1 aspartyl-tRNA synthetase [Saprolegnia diclina VS20]|eukprot:XP_008606187.1 aspartyl-tRNA synthetase [Saprolegnia diclina VS20]